MGDLSEPGDHKVAINALVRKRTEIAGQIRDLEHRSDQLRAEMIHVDSVLRLFAPDIEAEKIPARRHMPQRSQYFARGELTRTCLDALRDAAERGDGWLTGEEITVSTMQGKGLDPVHDRRLRADFQRRILQTLDALERRYGTVAKSGTASGGGSRIRDHDSQPLVNFRRVKRQSARDIGTRRDALPF